MFEANCPEKPVSCLRFHVLAGEKHDRPVKSFAFLQKCGDENSLLQNMHENAHCTLKDAPWGVVRVSFMDMSMVINPKK